jgi:hypothetical protein
MPGRLGRRIAAGHDLRPTSGTPQVGNYVIANPSSLGHFMIAETRGVEFDPHKLTKAS